MFTMGLFGGEDAVRSQAKIEAARDLLERCVAELDQLSLGMIAAHAGLALDLFNDAFPPGPRQHGCEPEPQVGAVCSVG